MLDISHKELKIKRLKVETSDYPTLGSLDANASSFSEQSSLWLEDPYIAEASSEESLH
jgi:hypothetical protein